MQRRSLPTEFRSLDFLESGNAVRNHSPSHSAFVEGLRERRPELFVDQDEVTFASRAPVVADGHGTAPEAPTAAPVIAPTGFVSSPVEEFTPDFGGIATPPSHDFPI
jgi:hypothetical protein